MREHKDISTTALHNAIRAGCVTLAGNSALKIYGTLHCNSGKRMKRTNRVFFESETEAVSMGFRPCGHCMKKKYQAWKEINQRAVL
jgi:methylphosphotriester-DNA--protein-cysteine methyltransferase